jgi:6,7-dimethyl-8-ribityllumazine synthase
MSLNKNVLLVCSPYYKDITDNLIEGATKFLELKSVNFKILHVQGALEIAPAIKFIYEKSINKPFFDGFIALGCVIRGETYHFEIVSNESARSLCDLSVRYSLPIGNGILTVENKKQAFERSDPKKLNKGLGAASACLSLIEIKSSDIYEKP